MPSPRVLKLADQIKTIVAEMLHNRIKDPRLGFVTITDVRLTGDTREATIFYTVLGEDADWAGTAAALQSATGLLRSTVGKRLGLRFAPTLAFVPDAVPETARQLDELIAAAKARDDEVARRREGATYAGEADPYKHDEPDEDGSDPGSNAAPGDGKEG
jgi:ribosome-binding factor A